MSVRFSNPSQTIGVFRFKVWPSKTTDSYNTADLAANFDLTDAMFGVPSSGAAWPPTTGIDGGVYREVKLLQNDRTPIGTVIAWWRPSASIAIPTGWVECTGQTLTAANHDFAGGGSITLPDLRNRFILGADSTKTALTAAAAVGSGAIDTASGAPGLGYVSGSNQLLLSIANLPAHDHGGGAHNHGGGNHSHAVTDPGHNHGVTASGTIYDIAGSDYQHVQENFHAGDNNLTSLATSSVITIKAAGTGVTIASSGSILSTDSPIQSQGSGTPSDNRPAYVGLIYLMRVKDSTAL